jgi:hypothetical protein
VADHAVRPHPGVGPGEDGHPGVSGCGDDLGDAGQGGCVRRRQHRADRRHDRQGRNPRGSCGGHRRHLVGLQEGGVLSESTPASIAVWITSGSPQCIAIRPPASCTRSAASGRSRSVTSFASPGKYRPGKYRPGGARKRPAVVTRGRPSSGPRPYDAWSTLPGSRSASTPVSRWARALARTRSCGVAPSPAGLASARWACTSTSPGRRKRSVATVLAPSTGSTWSRPSTMKRPRSTDSGSTMPRTCQAVT